MRQDIRLAQCSLITIGSLLFAYFASYPVYLKVQYGAHVDLAEQIATSPGELNWGEARLPAHAVIYSPVEWVCDHLYAGDAALSWESERVGVADVYRRLKAERSIRHILNDLSHGN